MAKTATQYRTTVPVGDMFDKPNGGLIRQILFGEGFLCDLTTARDGWVFGVASRGRLCWLYQAGEPVGVGRTKRAGWARWGACLSQSRGENPARGSAAVSGKDLRF